METIDPGLAPFKPSDLPANVDVKFEIRMSETHAADGTLLEWLSLSEESSSASSSESESEIEIESIQVSDTDVGRLPSKVNNLTKMFEQQKTLNKQPIRVAEKVNGNVKGLAGYFDQPRKGSMPSSASEMDSGFGQSTRSSTSFEGSIHDFESISSRGRSMTPMSRERSKSRMERGAERARAKLEKMAASLNQPVQKKRSKSVDPLNTKLPVKTSKPLNNRAKSEIRKESMAISSVPKRNTQKLLDEFERTKVNVDQNKKEISMTLSPQLELDNIANLAQVSKAVSPEKKKMKPTTTSEKTITVTPRKGKSGGQKIVLEQTIVKKTPKTPKTGFGAQATNKPLKKINLSNTTPYCFEVMHKRTNKQISNLHICPSDEFQNRIKLMVEINRMRYFALFYPTQKMEHIKTLVYVLTGVMPRLQEVYYRQLMESRLPFEDLISGSVDDVIQTKNTLQRHMSLGQLSRSDRLPSLEDSQMGDSILGSIQSSSQHDMSDTLSWNYRTSSHEGLSDEAYGSDKSGSGDDQSRGRQESWESRSYRSGKRSKSSDVRAGKFLNKLRGQKFSGLKPEHFHTSKKSIGESDFFACYGKLLKSTQLSDEEHDARHELICYMQTKLDDYQWATVRAFHDQVIKSWERGLISLDDSLEKFKIHYFDGKISKMKSKSFKQSRTTRYISPQLSSY